MAFSTFPIPTVTIGLQNWADWSPIVTSTAGVITTVADSNARWTNFNGTINFYLTILITTNGTGSGKVRFTLPATPGTNSNTTANGRIVSTGVSCNAAITASVGTCDIVKYDGSYPGADGITLVVSGSYESA